MNNKKLNYFTPQSNESNFNLINSSKSLENIDNKFIFNSNPGQNISNISIDVNKNVSNTLLQSNNEINYSITIEDMEKLIINHQLENNEPIQGKDLLKSKIELRKQLRKNNINKSVINNINNLNIPNKKNYFKYKSGKTLKLNNLNKLIETESNLYSNNTLYVIDDEESNEYNRQTIMSCLDNLKVINNNDSNKIIKISNNKNEKDIVDLSKKENNISNKKYNYELNKSIENIYVKFNTIYLDCYENFYEYLNSLDFKGIYIDTYKKYINLVNTIRSSQTFIDINNEKSIVIDHINKKNNTLLVSNSKTIDYNKYFLPIILTNPVNIKATISNPDYFLNFEDAEFNKLRSFFKDKQEAPDFNINSITFNESKNNSNVFKFSLKNLLNFNINFFNVSNYLYDVKYYITGYFNNREFKVRRTLDEFKYFRYLLLLNYPGIFIPKLPSNTKILSKDKASIKIRLVLIQSFLNKISKINILSSSKETRMFLDSRNVDYNNLPLELFQTDFKTILLCYKQYFPMFNCKIIEDINKNYYKEFNKSLNYKDIKDSSNDTKRPKSLEEINNKYIYNLNNKESEKLITFYSHMVKAKDLLNNIASFSLKAMSERLDLSKELELFYQYIFEYENNVIFDRFNIQNIKEFNKEIIECKLTEYLYGTNFEDPYMILNEWVNSELLDVESLIDCLEVLFKYDNLVNEKINNLEYQNIMLNNKNNPSSFKNWFFSKDFNDIQIDIATINDTKEDITQLIEFSDMLYKIVYFIIMPSFNKDKLLSYYNLLNIINNLESNSIEKEFIIVESLFDHCDELIKLNENLK